MRTHFLLFFVFTLFFSCKDDQPKQTDVPEQIQKSLLKNDWQHSITLTHDALPHYVPKDCEIDNSYHFSFGDTNALVMDRGKISCPDNGGPFEQLFKGKTVVNFTFDSTRNKLIFNNSKEESYLLEINPGNFTLTYQNSNPLANYIATRYHFMKK